MAVRDNPKLRAYLRAFDSAMRIYDSSKGFPIAERYSRTDQISRSSHLVCSQIADAWRKRRYPAAFVSKLLDADAEAAETCVWLDFARSCQFIQRTDHAELTDIYDHNYQELCKMMLKPEDWSIRA